MKKYHVTGAIVASKYLGVVEAENEEEARRKVWEDGDVVDLHVSVCHQCASEVSDPEIESVEVYPVEESK